MPIYALGDLEPDIHADAFIHPDATVIGDVVIGAGSSVWPGAVLRGDDDGGIRVGAHTSIQDGSVLHCTNELSTVVGDKCVIGHIVHLEGCTVEDFSLVGNGAVVLHRAVVQTGSLVGANAVVPNNMVVPSWAMALGIPAQIRENKVTPDMIQHGVDSYSARAKRYGQDLRRIG